MTGAANYAQALFSLSEELSQSDAVLSDIITAEITSAVALSGEQTEKIRKKLEKLTGKTVNVKCKIEKELLGGITLSFMGRQLDGSLRARLASIEDSLKNTIL